MYKYIRIVCPIVIVFLVHYVCTHLYLHICAPPLTLLGFLQSMLTTGGPVCKALLSVMHDSSALYALAILGSLSLVSQAVYTLFERGN